MFTADQPDLNWTNLEVWADVEKTMRFWLDRGVDGFRVDVTHGMSKPEGLPDAPAQPATLQEGAGGDPRFDQEEVHEVHRMIRAVIDHYPGRIAVGEVRVADDARFARYVRSDELHLGFNSRLLHAPFDATAIRQAIENTMDAVAEVNAPPAWILCNHDTSAAGHPLRRRRASAQARARAMLLVELALPGAVHLYNGEELGLPDVELPDSVLQDPVWETSGRTERGRDASRVPIPWEGGPPGSGSAPAPRGCRCRRSTAR